MKGLPAKDWSYNGRHIEIPRWAEIPDWYRRNNASHRLIQGVIDSVPPRNFRGNKRRFSWTIQLPRSISHIVVGVRDTDEVYWAVHRSFPGNPHVLSPFVIVSDEEWETQGDTLVTHDFTVVMDGDAKKPRLLRAHPGWPMPPVPGQSFATQDSVPYWNQYAFVYNRGDEMSDWGFAPKWYSGADKEPAA
jgi:hypothetical protein